MDNILKDNIIHSMAALARDSTRLFIGYNILFGNKAYGTLAWVSKEQCIEMPVAENLMTGFAIGLCLAGFKPVLIFERHDFMWLAMDQLVNHLDKLESMSQGQYKAPIIIRAIVGSRKPLDPGPQHCQDYTEIFKQVFSFPVIEVKAGMEYLKHYDTPVMFIERR